MPNTHEHPEKYLPVDIILPNLPAGSRRHVFKLLAREAADATGLNAHDLDERLWRREEQATSGVGDGVAIAHMCVRRLTRPLVLFAKLSSCLDFEALDDAPVDLVFLILSPKAEDRPYHLRRLAHVSRLLRQAHFREQLREADHLDTFEALFFDPENRRLAA